LADFKTPCILFEFQSPNPTEVKIKYWCGGPLHIINVPMRLHAGDVKESFKGRLNNQIPLSRWEYLQVLSTPVHSPFFINACCSWFLGSSATQGAILCEYHQLFDST
jgi:hypothetical protein